MTKNQEMKIDVIKQYIQQSAKNLVEYVEEGCNKGAESLKQESRGGGEKEVKQEITQKQFMELNKERADVVIGWLSNRGYYDTGEVHLTIGRMIEFLFSKVPNTAMGAMYQMNFLRWQVIFGNPPKEFYGVGFCDALWEAVKEVLEGEVI